MGSVYQRKGTSKLWIKYRDAGKRLVRIATEFRVGEEKSAERFLASEEAKVRAARAAGVTTGRVPTLEAYALEWFKRRERQKVATVADDRARLTLHVLPRLGYLRLDEVKSSDLARLFEEFRVESLGSTGKPPAPKTVWNTYGALSALYRDAAIDQWVSHTPCILTAHQLGEVVDADPTWRHKAHFTREELQTLLTEPTIPPDRRMLYGLESIGMFRHDEAARLRWADYNPNLEPLGELVLYDTKTGVPRWMPVHPMLAAMLGRWRLAGWPSIYGRPAVPNDLIVPTPPPTNRGPRVPAFQERDDAYSWKRQTKDLDALGWRHRRQHDLRRTGISLARDDGADEAKLYRCTHNPQPGTGKVIERYTSPEWRTLCAEVLKLRLRLVGEPKPGLLRAVPNEAQSVGLRGLSGNARESEGDPRAQ